MLLKPTTIFVAVFLLVVDPAAHAAKVRVDTGPDAEVTFDGLYRVTKGAKVARVWVKPDLDLTRYNKLLLQGAGISYRDVTDVSRVGSRSATEFPIDERDKERLPQLARDAFEGELSKLERYELTVQPGADVLLIRGALLDIVSFVPPDRPGRRRVLLRSVGEATLVLELRDSLSGEILARAADRASGDQGGLGISVQFRGDVRSEVKRVLRDWARLLRRRLDEITHL